MVKDCPYCRGRGTQTAPYAPRPYDCEDCRGTGTLCVCGECGCEYPMELGVDEGCPECNAEIRGMCPRENDHE